MDYLISNKSWMLRISVSATRTSITLTTGLPQHYAAVCLLSALLLVALLRLRRCQSRGQETMPQSSLRPQEMLPLPMNSNLYELVLSQMRLSHARGPRKVYLRPQTMQPLRTRWLNVLWRQASNEGDFGNL